METSCIHTTQCISIYLIHFDVHEPGHQNDLDTEIYCFLCMQLVSILFAISNSSFSFQRNFYHTVLVFVSLFSPYCGMHNPMYRTTWIMHIGYKLTVQVGEQAKLSDSTILCMYNKAQEN